MKRSTKIFAAAVVAVASLGTVGLSLAHPGGMGWGPGYGAMGGGPGHGMGMGYGPGAGMRGGMGGWMNASEAATIVSSRLATVKSELKITSEQEAAWAAYATQVQQQVESTQALRQQMQQKMHGTTPGTPEEFAALRESMFKLHQANAEARAKVAKDLYAVLTPEQRAIADRSLYGPAFGGGYGRGHGPGYGAGFGPGCRF